MTSADAFPFSSSDLSKFRAAHGADGRVLLLLALRVECDSCGAFFETSALGAAPAYEGCELGGIAAIELESRTCTACRKPR